MKIGDAAIATPEGWNESNTEKERITFASKDGRQQATISSMTFEAKPDFEDFKRICAHRLEAERSEAPNISIQADEPFEDSGTFGMFFSGKEPESGRLFSGYISQKNSEIITIYVESLGVESKSHFQSFQDFVKALKR